MNNTLIDNSTEALSMTAVLRECINTNGIDTIRIATGFWDLPGMALVESELRQFLVANPEHKLKLLIGKDAYVYASMLKEPKFKDASYPDDFIRIGLDELADNLKEEHLNALQLLLDFCKGDNPQIEVRKFKHNENDETQFLHSKCYVFTQGVDRTGIGIVGSSNFTKQGLEGNAELNYCEEEARIVCYPNVEGSTKKGHVVWFEEKWALADDWTKEFLEQVVKKSKAVEELKKQHPEPQPEQQPELEPQKETLSPYEVYIKYLQMHFGDIADTANDGLLKSYLPSEYKPLSYQIDAVKQCFHIMKHYGGFFLADVVGLGKTVVALLVVKRFIEETRDNNKVLLIMPPAIRPAWESTIKAFDAEASNKMVDHITIVTTGSIGKIDGTDNIDTEIDADEFESTLPTEPFGLIMIDESHNFRNSETLKYKALDALIDNITMQTGQPPYVGLMSATPQNNSPKDLQNQIYLFERNPQKSHFTDVPGGRLDSFFADKQQIFKNYRNDPSEAARKALKELSADIRQRVLDHIVVRRTRTDIQKHYAADSASLHFPTVCPPHRIDYEMDEKLVALFADTVRIILPAEEGQLDDGEHLGYYRYMAINYFSDKANAQQYEKHNLTVEGISARLAKIMQILLVKRLESSFEAFKESLNNLRQYTKNMLEMLERDCVFVCPDIDVNAEFRNADYEFDATAAAVRAKIAHKKGRNHEFRASDFKSGYKKLLEADYDLIDKLCKRWDNNDLDPKFDTFKEALKEQLFAADINNPHHYDEPRLVVFTEAIATQKTLSRYLKSKKYKVLEVSAANRNDLQEAIRRNFDANCPDSEKEDRYNILVTTEVLAEGVNLHRANVILNYDTPWNATRLMQRIGRVNRIGSKEDKVHVFNFYPTTQSNSQIHLIEKAYAKLQAFHTMFGEDNQVFSEMEELSEANFNQLVNGEESAFAQYFADLKQFASEHTERYEVLKTMEARNLGGKIITDTDSLVLVATDRNRQTCIRLAKNDDGQQTVVSPLQFMEILKNRMAEQFAEPSEAELQNIKERAFRCFHSFVNQSLTAQTTSKRMKNAQKIANEILGRLTTAETEARQALKHANMAIQNGNITAIKIMENYKANQNQGSLFGIDEDINQWVTAMFGHIAAQTARNHGEPYLALYSI
ncbi:MAG: DEAD/DEAH box helicase family protein [Bacteroidales bacterium]|nr:DEAD/DEAH box helicase family protein [Bacteroidales bacterium]